MGPFLIRHKNTVCLGALALTFLVVWQLGTFHSRGLRVAIPLGRGPLEVLDFLPRKLPPTAVVLFASGDGGWRRLEEAIGHGLQKHGYEVVGIDSPIYARTDYDLATLQADFRKLARSAEAKYGLHPLPLLIGGFSMGAAQAIAVAGGPHPPDGLSGVLLVEPLSRGRYGLRTQDKLNVLPTGPGTFAVADFAKTMGNLRVVQWHAALDTVDSTAWLSGLTAPYRKYNFPDAGHAYRHNREEFVRQLTASIDWLLNPVAEKVMAHVNKDGDR